MDTSRTSQLLIVGQLVLDHTVHVDVVHQRGTLFDVMSVDAGQVTFARGSYISTEYRAAKRLVFGPFLDFEEDVKELGTQRAIGRTFTRGDKVTIPPEKIQVLNWREDLTKLGAEKVGRLGYVVRSPGGGALNCCSIISQVFPKLPMRFTGIYSKETDDIIEDCLNTIVAETSIHRPISTMPVNIVLEGIMNDRIILKSPQPAELHTEPLDLNANEIFVNTVYNHSFACAALHGALRAEFAIVACTTSLLSEEPVAADARQTLQQYGISDESPSVFDMFRNVILPKADRLTFLFNEEEFHHILKYRSTGDERVYVKNGDGRILFDQLMLGFKRFRDLQAPNKTDVVVTVGEHGAFWLDDDDDLHYCSVLTSEETGKVARQKNAIGDLFAGVVVGLIFAYNREYRARIVSSSGELIKESWRPCVLMAASAAADAGVYDGFYNVRKTTVNSSIHLKTRHYRFLGPLNEVRSIKDLESLEEVIRNRLPELTKGRIESEAVLEQMVPGALLR